VTGLEFKFKGTVAREKAERCIQLLPCLRLRPEIEVANLNVEEKIAAPCLILYSKFSTAMTPAISAINVCSNFKKI
jgi:hypothetical protein